MEISAVAFVQVASQDIPTKPAAIPTIGVEDRPNKNFVDLPLASYWRGRIRRWKAAKLFSVSPYVQV